MSLASACESCGRPMAAKADHGGQDPDNPYCIHCTDLKGKLVSFEKMFEEEVTSTIQTRSMTREAAEKSVLDQMAKMPAWRDKVEKMLKPQ